MRVRFSGAMPLPSSSTSTQTRAASPSPSTPLRTVIVPRGLSTAWAALTSRFMNTWFISEGMHCTSGSAPYWRTTSALYLISLLTMFSVESMPWCRSVQAQSSRESTCEKSFRSCTILRTRRMPSRDSAISVGTSSFR